MERLRPDGTVENWAEFAKAQGWISEVEVSGEKMTKYLRVALADDGGGLAPEAVYTVDKRPGTKKTSAILVDHAGGCYFRTVRRRGNRLIVTSPLWPHATRGFPLSHFDRVEQVVWVRL